LISISSVGSWLAGGRALGAEAAPSSAACAAAPPNAIASASAQARAARARREVNDSQALRSLRFWGTYRRIKLASEKGVGSLAG
jgi:hypothetical protein